MSFTPVIHPAILIPLALAAVAVAGVALTRAHGIGPRVRWGLRLLLVLACVLTLMRPGLPGGKVEVFAENADIFIVVDTSASIVAEDWADGKPRLDGVREDVQAIVQQYPGARFALLTFDTTTSVRLPLTTDSTALISGMAVLTPEVTDQSSGTSITQAHQVLAQMLAAANASGEDRARLVFYLGDGEQTSFEEPGSFASSKQYVGGGLVLGYGTEQGGPMRVTSANPTASDAGYIQYQGRNALSVIDEAHLQQIADQFEIGYFHRTADAALELPPIPKTTTRNSTGEVGSTIELYWIPASLAALLLAGEIARMTAEVARTGRLTRRERSERGEPS